MSRFLAQRIFPYFLKYFVLIFWFLIIIFTFSTIFIQNPLTCFHFSIIIKMLNFLKVFSYLFHYFLLLKNSVFLAAPLIAAATCYFKYGLWSPNRNLKKGDFYFLLKSPFLLSFLQKNSEPSAKSEQSLLQITLNFSVDRPKY